jgi:hypothetical protein
MLASMIGGCSFDIHSARSLGAAFFSHKTRSRAVIAPRVRSVSLGASLLLGIISLCPTSALAGEVKRNADEARAESLFEEGLALQRLGQVEQACERFEASTVLAALPHALLQVGNCREPDDPLGALASFESALDAAGKVTDSTRRQAYEGAAKKRIASLEARIPTLIVYPPPSPNVRVEIAAATGGEPLAMTRFGEARRLNPGKYKLTASAPGAEPYVLDLELKSEQRLELDIPPLDPVKGEAAAGKAEPASPTEPASPMEPAAPMSEPSEGLRFGTGPVVLASAGGALILTSLITGRISSSARSELDQECSPPDEVTGLRACDASLADTKSRVEDYALATDVLWIGGSLLAGAGITWFLLDQKDSESPAIEAACSGVGCNLLMKGTF